MGLIQCFMPTFYAHLLFKSLAIVSRAIYIGKRRSIANINSDKG